MIRSHIIPKFYLEQFAIPSSRGRSSPGRIWVYEKGKTPRESGTSVQGAEKGYFGFVAADGSIEESLETELARIEDDCNDTLVCARSDLFHWPPRSREKLAFYAALLYSRATQRRDMSMKNHRKIVDQMLQAVDDKKLVADIAAALSTKFKKQVRPEYVKRGITAWLRKAQEPSTAKNSFLSDLIRSTKLIATLLIQKNPWRIIRPPEGREFLTSDNPLVSFIHLPNGMLHPGHGFRKPEVLAGFPLAPDAYLLMGDGWNTCQTLEDDDLQNLNTATVSISDRYIYTKTFSEQVQILVDECGGRFRYGISAFLPMGVKLPDASRVLRNHFGIGIE